MTFSFLASWHHRVLLSFPTRRSSDLNLLRSACRGRRGPLQPARFAPARATEVSRRRRWQKQRNLGDRKSTRLNFSHPSNSYDVFCLTKKTTAAVARY